MVVVELSELLSDTTTTESATHGHIAGMQHDGARPESSSKSCFCFQGGELPAQRKGFSVDAIGQFDSSGRQLRGVVEQLRDVVHDGVGGTGQVGIRVCSGAVIAGVDQLLEVVLVAEGESRLLNLDAGERLLDHEQSARGAELVENILPRVIGIRSADDDM